MDYCSSAPKDEADIPEQYRKNVQIIRIAVVEWIPFLDVNETETSVNICGPMARLLDDLRTTLGFNYTLNVPKNLDDRTPGELTINGSATGVLGMLMRNESDMSGVPVAADHEVFEAVTFTDALMMDHYNILSPKLPPQTNFVSYVLAFDWIIWTCIAVSLIVLALTNWLITTVKTKECVKLEVKNAKRSRRGLHLIKSAKSSIKISRRQLRSAHDGRRKSRSRIEPDLPNFERNRQRRQSVPAFVHSDFAKAARRTKYTSSWLTKLSRFGDHYLIFHQILFIQSLSNMSKFFQSRLLICIWWMAVLTLGGCFSGNLLFNLLRDVESKQLDKLDDVFSHPTIKLIAVRGGPLKMSTVNQLKDKSQVVFTNSDNITARETVDLVVGGTHSILINRLSLESIVSRRGSCHFHKGSEKILPTSIGLILRKSMAKHFVEAVNIRLRLLTRTGVFNQWLKELYVNDTECLVIAESRKDRKLGFKDFEGLAIMTSFGIALSILFSMIEIYIQREPTEFIKPVVKDLQGVRNSLRRALIGVLAAIGLKVRSEVRKRKQSLAIGRLRRLSMSAVANHRIRVNPEQLARRRMTVVGLGELNLKHIRDRNLSVASATKSQISIRTNSISSCSEGEDSFEDQLPKKVEVRPASRRQSTATIREVRGDELSPRRRSLSPTVLVGRRMIIQSNGQLTRQSSHPSPSRQQLTNQDHTSVTITADVHPAEQLDQYQSQYYLNKY